MEKNIATMKQETFKRENASGRWVLAETESRDVTKQFCINYLDSVKWFKRAFPTGTEKCSKIITNHGVMPAVSVSISPDGLTKKVRTFSYKKIYRPRNAAT